VAAAAAVSLAVPALGSGGSTSSTAAEARVPKLVFPLVAKTTWWDNYGDPRPNGKHAGIDIMAPWRSPVVAVEAGHVKHWDSGLGGCMLHLYGRSGTMYMYIHLNNDVSAENDNRGRCHEVAFTVKDGATVDVGEQIAWSGDSGDADGNPHLHFEVHPNGGADVNPFPYLSSASKPLFAAKIGSPFSLALRGRVQATGPESLRIVATNVRAYPGGRWLGIDPRAVALQILPASEAEVELARVVGNPAPAPATTPRVSVYTVKSKVTLDAIVGAPGALTAGRISPLR
jgi:hypothetical protein